MVQGITTNTIKDPTNLPQWEDRFKAVMGHLGHIGNAFEAMMYIIYSVFPMVENFNSWRMENQATAMEAVSKVLQDLNNIKAMFNNCQTPGYWSKDMNGTKLEDEINKLLSSLQHNPALKGIKDSVITQLQLITHYSDFPQLWRNMGTKKNLDWVFGDKTMKWFDGSKEVSGSSSTFLKWMWSQEWQGLNIIPEKPTNWYRITMWKKRTGA